MLSDQTSDPNFLRNVTEALGFIKATSTGAKLLEKIAQSTPRVSQPVAEGFPVGQGCKVLIAATKERAFSGYISVFGTCVDRPFMVRTEASAPANSPYDRTAASTPGQGSVCTTTFNCTIYKTTQGEKTWPFIILAHELIHAYRALYGTLLNDTQQEELRTVGLPPFDNPTTEPITENKIRQEAKLPVRTSYF